MLGRKSLKDSLVPKNSEPQRISHRPRKRALIVQFEEMENQQNPQNNHVLLPNQNPSPNQNPHLNQNPPPHPDNNNPPNGQGEMTLRQYFLPSTYEPNLAINIPNRGGATFEIKHSTLAMVPSFYGKTNKSPLDHVTDFVEICSTLNFPNVT